MTLPTRKRLWQQIVRAKIKAQGELLREIHGNDHGLIAMAARVRTGDQGNLEAQAARKYWGLVFGDSKFRRGSDKPDQNRHLDYGYTVLRAAVARALCAAGLHPSIGLRHKNRYDAFCLAADVMEPFRPLVDRRVRLEDKKLDDWHNHFALHPRQGGTIFVRYRLAHRELVRKVHYRRESRP
jgi:CRISPR-associated protein Cas1